ncbi:hypothetical protein KIL84_021862 [Mauremys mutica]|uniref:Uncharacterized protein n=1 Tax=Mauremys mutica TaxID=74926 RepID=A0A9D4B3K3_9SAUR|nr:hypothetical protein KIL84_021862 [Mauremys mutica]
MYLSNSPLLQRLSGGIRGGAGGRWPGFQTSQLCNHPAKPQVPGQQLSLSLASFLWRSQLLQADGNVMAEAGRGVVSFMQWDSNNPDVMPSPAFGYSVTSAGLKTKAPSDPSAGTGRGGGLTRLNCPPHPGGAL